jgi:hypothetical protein
MVITELALGKVVPSRSAFGLGEGRMSLRSICSGDKPRALQQALNSVALNPAI